MRLLHLTGGFPKPTETFIKRYVQKSSRFAEVGVASFHYEDVDMGLQGVSFYTINREYYTRKNATGATRFLSEKLTGNRSWYSDFDQAISKFNPDIIHCHFGNEGIAMMEFEQKIKKRVPYVTSFYGYDISSQPATDKQYLAGLQKLLKHGNAFFAEGPELKKKVLAFGCADEKCLVNPLLIPVEDYPRKTTYRKPGDPIRFLFVGRFIEKKGFHIFLEAIGRILKKMDPFIIDVIGAGPMQQDYERLIEKNNLDGLINWKGMMNHDAIIGMMKNYDFLVHPSLTAKDGESEGGAPTIIIEAQAAGLPVITSDHADIPYVMGYHDFLAKENNVSSLAEAIEKMINCENVREYADKGIAKASAQHSLQHNSIYENNLKNIIARQ